MVNKIRILMLLLALSVAGYAGYSFLSSFETTAEDVEVRITKDGVDVEIKKFNVVHENSERKEWELKADVAQINQSTNTTTLSKVEYIYINENDRTFKVYADSGILQNETNDLNLEGHVKMVIESALINDRFKNKPAAQN